MNKIRISLLIVLSGIYSIAFCQSQLDFISKKDNKKKITFKVGDNVGYAKIGFTAIRTGKLEAIQDSSITIDGKIIKIEDIRLIGHRRKGASLISFTTAFLSGAVLGWFTLPTSNSTEEKIVGLCISIPLFIAAEIIASKNKVYRVQDKYRFELLP